jgi:hypothetical protein
VGSLSLRRAPTNTGSVRLPNRLHLNKQLYHLSIAYKYMPIHTHKLPTFALYTAYTDEFGVTAFGACREEALNNLAEEIRQRAGVGESDSPAREGNQL